MDIEILLILQELRFMLGSAGEWIAINLSDALAALAIVIPFVLFWCFNKRKGQLMLAVFAGSLMINQLLKLACAVYRPWIRDPRVKPGKQSLRTATGYSFPSSHTQLAATAYGDLAFEGKGTKVSQSIFFLSLMFLAGFLRLYLGVHTPQDVIVGMATAFIMIPVCEKVFTILAVDRKRDLWAAVLYTGFVIASIVYALNKSYPMDMADGHLLVDPLEMVQDFMLSCGLSYGIVMGGILEHRFVRFETDCTKKEKVLRAITGFMMIGVLYVATKFTAVIFTDLYNALFRGWLIGFAAVFVHPLLFKKFEERKALKDKKEED